MGALTPSPRGALPSDGGSSRRPRRAGRPSHAPVRPPARGAGEARWPSRPPGAARSPGLPSVPGPGVDIPIEARDVEQGEQAPLRSSGRPGKAARHVALLDVPRTLLEAAPGGPRAAQPGGVRRERFPPSRGGRSEGRRRARRAAERPGDRPGASVRWGHGGPARSRACPRPGGRIGSRHPPCPPRDRSLAGRRAPGSPGSPVRPGHRGGPIRGGAGRKRAPSPGSPRPGPRIPPRRPARCGRACPDGADGRSAGVPSTSLPLRRPA